MFTHITISLHRCLIATPETDKNISPTHHCIGLINQYFVIDFSKASTSSLAYNLL